ncbi:MAG: hypothetical protein IPL99_25730 [Candidatus Competibacteraceae bacterium]|nr:hypothetical protein [Candidatus Competibacteraceae bacterium]
MSVHPSDPKQDHLQYIGVTYQCVEYARKWRMKTGASRSAASTAPMRFCISPKGKLETQQAVPPARSINGTARRPPRRGDLAVYYPGPGRSGMAAWSCRRGDGGGCGARQCGFVEENYDNRPWQNPQAFARQIRLFEVGTVHAADVPPTAHRNAEGGRIAGWLYPLDP